MANTSETAATIRNKKGTISTFDGLLDAVADALDPQDVKKEDGATDPDAAEKRGHVSTGPRR